MPHFYTYSKPFYFYKITFKNKQKIMKNKIRSLRKNAKIDWITVSFWICKQNKEKLKQANRYKEKCIHKWGTVNPCLINIDIIMELMSILTLATNGSIWLAELAAGVCILASKQLLLWKKIIYIKHRIHTHINIHRVRLALVN